MGAKGKSRVCPTVVIAEFDFVHAGRESVDNRADMVAQKFEFEFGHGPLHSNSTRTREPRSQFTTEDNPGVPDPSPRDHPGSSGNRPCGDLRNLRVPRVRHPLPARLLTEQPGGVRDGPAPNTTPSGRTGLATAAGMMRVEAVVAELRDIGYRIRASRQLQSRLNLPDCGGTPKP
jgi:hypothetical protein